MRPDAEAAVHRYSTGVQTLVETTLTYATVTAAAASPRGRGPTIVHRLVWAVVGARALGGATGGGMQVLWLVDAHSGRQLTEIPVPAALPPTSGAAATGR